MTPRRPDGFSAIELLVVISIAAVLLAWGYPRLATLAQIYRLDGAAWALSTDMQKVRLRAIQEGRPFRVVFNTASKTYQVESDPLGTGSWVPEGAPREIEDARQLAVSVTPAGSNPQFTTRGILIGGTAARVTLEAPMGARRQVHLELGGRIYVNGN